MEFQTSETRNSVPTEPVPEEPLDVTTTAGTDKLDIPWETIQAAQEADPTLQKIRELMWNPDPPQNVNEFGIDVVHLWSQRKSLEIINGGLHRNYETPDGLIEHRQILVPEPLRKRFLYWVHGDPTSGHFGVQKDDSETPTLCLLVGVATRCGTVRPTMRHLLPIQKGSNTAARCHEKRSRTRAVSKVPY